MGADTGEIYSEKSETILTVLTDVLFLLTWEHNFGLADFTDVLESPVSSFTILLKIFIELFHSRHFFLAPVYTPVTTLAFDIFLVIVGTEARHNVVVAREEEMFE